MLLGDERELKRVRLWSLSEREGERERERKRKKGKNRINRSIDR